MDHAWAAVTHKWWIVLISPIEKFFFSSIWKRQLHLFSVHRLTSIHHCICQKAVHSVYFLFIYLFTYPPLLFFLPNPPGRYSFPCGDLWPIGNQIKVTFRTFNIQALKLSFQASCQREEKRTEAVQAVPPDGCCSCVCVCVCVVMACSSAICQVMEKVGAFLIGDVPLLFVYLLKRSVNILRLETKVQLVFLPELHNTVKIPVAAPPVQHDYRF